MNRNVESRFAQLPVADIQRSIFRRNNKHITTFNVGDLIPLYWDEVLPGDSWSMQTNKLVRLQTLLTPIMDNLYMDTYWFAVPNRILWSHWKEFCGENNTSAWVQTTQYTVPKIKAPSGGFATGTIADYLGIPVGVQYANDDPRAPMALPFRAYAMICNDFFRDENNTDPLNIPLGDSNQTGTNGGSYINDVANGGLPFVAAKYHDRFTSALPNPQKGNPVSLPLGVLPEDIPVYPQFINNLRNYGAPAASPSTPYAYLPFLNGTDHYYDKLPGTFWYKYTDFTNVDPTNLKAYATKADNLYPYQPGTDGAEVRHNSFSGSNMENFNISYGTGVGYNPLNLVANPSGYGFSSIGLGSVSINELRLAFQYQKMLERNARGGTRYIELLKAHFGVTSPDARMQRPEYLGGNRIPLQINQVTNTAQTNSDFLGDTGAMSVTSDSHYDFEKSFTEHCILMCVGVVRYDHTYSQGLAPKWSRTNFTDFYLPVFANIGESPIYGSEIYLSSSKSDNSSVFGYQEAWSEYRYAENMCSGEMRPGITGSLASWHLGDYYQTAPTLSDAWIREDKTNVDRVLAVSSSVSNQCLADFYFNATVTRPMPMYSIPGLVDHH